MAAEVRDSPGFGGSICHQLDEHHRDVRRSIFASVVETAARDPDAPWRIVPCDGFSEFSGETTADSETKQCDPVPQQVNVCSDLSKLRQTICSELQRLENLLQSPLATTGFEHPRPSLSTPGHCVERPVSPIEPATTIENAFDLDPKFKMQRPEPLNAPKTVTLTTKRTFIDRLYDSELNAPAQLTSQATKQTLESAANSLDVAVSQRPRPFLCKTRGRARTPLQRITRSNLFELAAFTVILTNSLLLAAQVQYNATHRDESEPLVFNVLQSIYNIVFLLELVLRFGAEGFRGLFCNKETAGWAVLDVVIVMASMMETVSFIAAGSGGDSTFGSSANNVRTLRVVRMARVLRALRVFRIIRFLAAAHTLMFSILATLRSLVWATFLMAIIICVFAVAFTQVAVDSTTDEVAMDYYWGSLPSSMSTLFQAISNGVSWRDAYEQLCGESLLMGMFLHVYIIFAYFGMLNVVTGVFCNSAIASAQRNPEIIASHLGQVRQQNLNNLKALFHGIDVDDSGTICLEEFETLVEDEMAQAYLQALDLNMNDAWTLFTLLDADKSGEISIQEFLTGCEALRGKATSIDVACVLTETRACRSQMEKHVQLIEGLMSELAVVMEQQPKSPISNPSPSGRKRRTTDRIQDIFNRFV